MYYQCHLNTLPLLHYLFLNGYNTKLKNNGVCWSLLGIQIVLHVSFKAVYIHALCFVKIAQVKGEINELWF